MGGDDLWAIALLLANQDRFHIQGISTVFGNVSRDIATRNASNFINALGFGHIPVIPGATRPMDGTLPFGDDAYGENGVGGVTFPDTSFPPRDHDVTDWLKATIENNVQKMTVFVTGPATNMALLMQTHPQLAAKIERFIIMAGANKPPGKDGQPVYLENGEMRRGNITPHAEFNAFQDPAALNALTNSGVPCHFLSMDANQRLVLSPARMDKMRSLNLRYGEEMLNMLNAVAPLDMTKFGVEGAFIHDPNVVTYALADLFYKTSCPGSVHFFEQPADSHGQSWRGKTMFIQEYNSKSRIHWVHDVAAPDAVFDMMLGMFQKILRPANTPRQAPSPL